MVLRFLPTAHSAFILNELTPFAESAPSSNIHCFSDGMAGLRPPIKLRWVYASAASYRACDSSGPDTLAIVNDLRAVDRDEAEADPLPNAPTHGWA
jgi:hypothetical protein